MIGASDHSLPFITLAATLAIGAGPPIQSLAQDATNDVTYELDGPHAHRSLAALYRSVGLVYEDVVLPRATLDFAAPLVGVRFDGPVRKRTSATVHVAYGRATWGAGKSEGFDDMFSGDLIGRYRVWTIADLRRSRIAAEVPLQFTYRRLRVRDGDAESLGVLLVGPGAGGQILTRVSSRIVLELNVRSTLRWSLPEYGADSGFFGPPLSTTVATRLQLHFERIFTSRLGFTVEFLLQLEWLRLYAPEFVEDGSTEWLRFSNGEQGFGVGFNL